MIYPAPLKKGSKIAITAFSAGISDNHERRFIEIIRTLEDQGFEVILGECLRGISKHVSASAERRAAELQKFLLDDAIDAIAPPWGGELAIELLPHLDFDLIARSKPKWLFGFSDVSTITSVLSYKLNWATVHSSNLMDLIDTSEDPLVANTLNYLRIAEGGEFTQYSSDRHSRSWPDIDVDPLASIVGELETEWKWLVAPHGKSSLSGRLIGGCWDTLIHLFETPYLNLKDFKSRGSEGLLLFLENVEMSPCELVRAIHNMEFRGVFKAIDGLILGRNFRIDSENPDDLQYLEVLDRHLKNKGIPVIIDVDIGHAPPNLTLVNGAVAEIGIFDGKGFIKQKLL